MNPNQLRSNGIDVDDVPRQFKADSAHSLTAKVDDTGEPIVIPLTLNGIMSGIATEKPTWEQYAELPKIILTSGAPWNPRSSHWKDEETKIADREVRNIGTIRTADLRRTLDGYNDSMNYDRHVASIHAMYDAEALREYQDDDEFAVALIKSINVASDDFVGDELDGRRDEDVYPKDCDCRHVAKLSATDKETVLTPALLSQRWNIGLDSAKRTLQNTTQSGIRNIYGPGNRKLRQRLWHLRYPKLREKFYTDTMFAAVKSIRGFKGAQVFTNGRGFDVAYPHVSKREAGTGLRRFIRDVGIPETLVIDNAPEQTGGEMGKVCREHHIQVKTTVPYHHWRNLAESSIRELKPAVKRALSRKRAPERAWCFALEWVSSIRRHTALDISHHWTEELRLRKYSGLHLISRRTHFLTSIKW